MRTCSVRKPGGCSTARNALRDAAPLEQCTHRRETVSPHSTLNTHAELLPSAPLEHQQAAACARKSRHLLPALLACTSSKLTLKDCDIP